MIIAHSAATRIVSPVVYEAAPEHRKAVGVAISSSDSPALMYAVGCVRRRKGTAEFSGSRRAEKVPPNGRFFALPFSISE